MNSVCKPFDLFVLFGLFIASLFLFYFVALQVCLRRAGCSISGAIYHLARLKCREESK